MSVIAHAPRSEVLFQNLCYCLNVLRLSWVAAVLRCAIFHAQTRHCTSGYYHPESTITTLGYKGWVDHDRLGVLAFLLPDGRLKFRW